MGIIFPFHDPFPSMDWNGLMGAKYEDVPPLSLTLEGTLCFGGSFYYYWILKFWNAQLQDFFIKLICQNRNPFWRRLGCKGHIQWMCEYYVHKCLLGRLFPADMTKRWEIRSQISLTTQTLKEKWSQLMLMGLVRRMSWCSSSCQSHIPSWTTPATTASLSSGASLGG